MRTRLLPAFLALAVSVVAQAPKGDAPARLVLSAAELKTKRVSTVPPVYPPQARRAHVTGTVRLSVIVSKEGTIVGCTPIKGHRLLVQAAIDSVRQWKYKPSLLNGEPVEVSSEVDVTFTLSY